MSNVPERLETERLILTRPTAEDLPDLVAMHSDSQVMATLGGLRSAEELAAMHTRLFACWQRDGFGWWVARDRLDGRFVGRGGLRRVEIEGAPEVEVGYGLMPEFWGRGLAVELTRASLRIGFERAGLVEVVCFTLPTNVRSRRVMEKSGFVFERNAVYAGLPHVLYRMRRESASIKGLT